MDSGCALILRFILVITGVELERGEIILGLDGIAEFVVDGVEVDTGDNCNTSKFKRLTFCTILGVVLVLLLVLFAFVVAFVFVLVFVFGFGFVLALLALLLVLTLALLAIVARVFASAIEAKS